MGNNHLYIEIEDTGGIDEATTKIFDPFFSTKDKCLGLGLSVVYKIVNQHNGQIHIFDTESGALFRLTFSTN